MPLDGQKVWQVDNIIQSLRLMDIWTREIGKCRQESLSTLSYSKQYVANDSDNDLIEFMTINDISLSVQYIVFPPILPDTLFITFYPVGIFRDTLSLIFSNRRVFLAHVPKLIQVSEENLEFATEFTIKSQ